MDIFELTLDEGKNYNEFIDALVFESFEEVYESLSYYMGEIPYASDVVYQTFQKIKQEAGTLYVVNKYKEFALSSGVFEAYNFFDLTHELEEIRDKIEAEESIELEYFDNEHYLTLVESCVYNSNYALFKEEGLTKPFEGVW